jgi:hypothetical protein
MPVEGFCLLCLTPVASNVTKVYQTMLNEVILYFFNNNKINKVCTGALQEQ